MQRGKNMWHEYQGGAQPELVEFFFEDHSSVCFDVVKLVLEMRNPLVESIPT